MSGGTGPRETRPSQPPSIASTRSGVGGTTGRPSVQPRSNISSNVVGASRAEIAAASSGSIAALDEHPGLTSGPVASGIASPAPRSAPARPMRATRAAWSQPVTAPAIVPARSTRTAVGTETSR